MRVARKHIGWYVGELPGGEAFRREIRYVLEDAGAQLAAVGAYFLDGRVKTLHPKIHGGLLGRRDVPAHAAAMRGARHRADRPRRREPLSRSARRSRAGTTLEEAIEQIDIGGPVDAALGGEEPRRT